MKVYMRHNIPEIRSRLRRLEAAVKTRYKERIVEAMIDTLWDVKEGTPRDTGTMAEGWRMNVISGSPKGRVPVAGVIWNVYAEEDRFKYKSRSIKALYSDVGSRLEGVVRTKINVDGRLVLRALEYGAKPHTIYARPVEEGGPGVLTFETKDGRWISTTKVSHPGNKPYGMIRMARANLRKKVRKINNDMYKYARDVLEGRG